MAAAANDAGAALALALLVVSRLHDSWLKITSKPLGPLQQLVGLSVSSLAD